MSNQISLTNDTLIDNITIQSIMHFPNNQHLHDSWYALNFASAHANDNPENKPTLVPNYILKVLVESPPYSELQSKMLDSAKKGIISGDILLTIYLMNYFKMPEPSFNKAVFVAQERAKTASYGDGSKMATSDRTIKKYFSEYQSVAHLWAAYGINEHYPYTTHKKIFTEGLSDFLEVSAGLLKFGRSFVPIRKKSKKPIIHSQDTWELPNKTPIKKLSSERFPNVLDDILKKYDATEYRI